MRRRNFLWASGIGGAALLGVFQRPSARAEPHHMPRARRMVSLFMAGGPSQFETFDYKPGLVARAGTELPASVRGDQPVTTMTSGQGSFPIVPCTVPFRRHGAAGTWVSDILPYTAAGIDRLTVVKTLSSVSINHEPAVTEMQTGHFLPGRPSMGAWIAHALGPLSPDLPAFVVLTSAPRYAYGEQPLSARYWGSGFLPAQVQGVPLRGATDPVLYIDDPTGMSPARRAAFLELRDSLDALRGEPSREGVAQQAAFRLADRMMQSVPDIARVSDEPASTWSLYGDAARTPGTYAWNCLMARRLLERGVRFVQLFHRGWDSHWQVRARQTEGAQATDQASAALVADLERRGLLDDTIVHWGGEFGRTVYGQGQLTVASEVGRDHHPRCQSVWFAGGGFRAGTVFGSTDDFGYNVVEGSFTVHDMHATLLHLLGFDHTRLTFRAEGRDFRLTDVAGRVVHEILSSGV